MLTPLIPVGNRRSTSADNALELGAPPGGGGAFHRVQNLSPFASRRWLPTGRTLPHIVQK